MAGSGTPAQAGLRGGPHVGCIGVARSLGGAILVAGNHDLAVATGQGLEHFNATAADAARAHSTWLSAEERDLLAGLPLRRSEGGATLVHGSLVDPVWEYVWDSRSAYRSLAEAPTDLSCNGHTHIPALFTLRGDDAVAGAYGRGTLALEGRVLVNPGSVGLGNFDLRQDEIEIAADHRDHNATPKRIRVDWHGENDAPMQQVMVSLNAA